MAKYGLVGKNIGYSFSKDFFTVKFEREKRADSYHNFDIESIESFEEIIQKHSDLKGLNITIPFKESILPFLDKIDKEAKAIGAVNTVKINSSGKLNGYNTDHYGFARALTDVLPLKEKTALILGTGGASKAIRYVLQTMKFDIKMVSRTKADNTVTYDELNQEMIANHFLIVNTTPLGTFPNVENFPNIPYHYLTSDHFLFDLTYNPRTTTFMKLGAATGASVCNGLKMLEHQAKKSWKIWRK